MAPATTTDHPTVNVPHSIIDIHVSEGTLFRELFDCYQSLHGSRQLWTDSERSHIRIRLEIRHPRGLPHELNDSRRTELRIYAEHHGPGRGYLEGTPFLVACGLWLCQPGMAKRWPALARFFRREARHLHRMSSAR